MLILTVTTTNTDVITIQTAHEAITTVVQGVIIIQTVTGLLNNNLIFQQQLLTLRDREAISIRIIQGHLFSHRLPSRTEALRLIEVVHSTGVLRQHHT